MSETLGPLPLELYIEVTNRCNSRCQTCVRTFETQEPPRDLTLDEFRTLVDPLPGLRRVVLHGVGEPLLNPDVAAMVAHLKQRAQPPHMLFNTNAILLSPDIGQALVEAQLDELRISSDAASRELYARIRGVDAFDRMVDNVRRFADEIRRTGVGSDVVPARGPRLSLWCTAMHENLAELPEMVRLAHRLGVNEVYVQRLVFFGQGLARQEQSLFRAMQAAEDDLLRRAEALAEELEIRFRASGATSPRQSLLSSDAESRRLPGADGRPWARCRRPWTVAYITVHGNVLPCCFSPFTTQNYPRLILGNAFRTPLTDIWHGAPYHQFRSALQSDAPPEACDRCGVFWSL